MEDLTGRYLKALVDKPNGGCVKAGEYGLIRDRNLWNIDFETQKGYTFTDALKYPDKVELMPLGFNPNQINILQNLEIW